MIAALEVHEQHYEIHDILYSAVSKWVDNMYYIFGSQQNVGCEPMQS